MLYPRAKALVLVLLVVQNLGAERRTIVMGGEDGFDVGKRWRHYRGLDTNRSDRD